MHDLRGHLVVLDTDVAQLFGVLTERLNEQVRRNLARFGDDFAFRLTEEERRNLIPQIAGSNAVGTRSHGGRRKPPLAFTEHGVVMAATVLKSAEAASASRMIVRVFVETRRQQTEVKGGRNLPVVIDGQQLVPIDAAARTGLMAKVNAALGRALDAVADPRANTTVRDELQAVAAEGLGAIKAYLAKGGLQNDKTLAEVRKLLAEADVLAAETMTRHTENQHRQFALLAKQLRLTLEINRYLETGTMESLLATLKDLER
ncbi:MAG: ORF6N domain-containing protein [Beijerinckiaceae bacterium]